MTDNEVLQMNLQQVVFLPDGWKSLYEELIRGISAIDHDAKVVQAKEKFGEMRVYMEVFNEPIYDLIDAAAKRSKTLCQMCGSAGIWSKTVDGFYATVCPDHSTGFESARSAVLRHVRIIVPADKSNDGDV